MPNDEGKQTEKLPVVDLDDQWFAEHPFAKKFHRPLVNEELAALNLEDDGTWWSVVARSDDPAMFVHGFYQRGGKS